MRWHRCPPRYCAFTLLPRLFSGTSAESLGASAMQVGIEFSGKRGHMEDGKKGVRSHRVSVYSILPSTSRLLSAALQILFVAITIPSCFDITQCQSLRSSFRSPLAGLGPPKTRVRQTWKSLRRHLKQLARSEIRSSACSSHHPATVLIRWCYAA